MERDETVARINRCDLLMWIAGKILVSSFDIPTCILNISHDFWEERAKVSTS